MKDKEERPKIMDKLAEGWTKGREQKDKMWERIRTSARASRRRDLIIRGTLLMIVVLGLLVPCVWQFQKAYSSKEWPTVLGQISSSEVRSESAGTVSIRWRYYVNYVYVVDGIRYSGKWSDTAPSREQASEVIKTEYRQNQNASVYYDPLNPDTSVLEPGVHIRANHSEFLLILSLIGGVLFITALVIIIFNISKIMKERRVRGAPPSPEP